MPYELRQGHMGKSRHNSSSFNTDQQPAAGFAFDLLTRLDILDNAGRQGHVASGALAADHARQRREAVPLDSLVFVQVSGGNALGFLFCCGFGFCQPLIHSAVLRVINFLQLIEVFFGAGSTQFHITLQLFTIGTVTADAFDFSLIIVQVANKAFDVGDIPLRLFCIFRFLCLDFS